MPGFDRTGPNGQGTGTGRRMGPCFSQDYQSGYRRGGAGMGRGGMGRGMQRGLRSRRNVNNQIEAIDEPVAENASSEQLYDLENRMSTIEQKLDQLLQIQTQSKKDPEKA